MIVRSLLGMICLASIAQARPNVVIVITDDQGYGDLGCNGNERIETPNVDQFARQSVSLSDYHVAPTCSPTRAAFLTGHWTNRTGVWHTIAGRSMLRADETTLGNYFQDAGYRTAMFGKWHLGRQLSLPRRRSRFAEVYRHGGGGVGQTPDHWNNAYFDGVYQHNGHPEAGQRVSAPMCSSMRLWTSSKRRRDPANRSWPTWRPTPRTVRCTPRSEYMDRYEDLPPKLAAFYAMCTNIDDNFGRLRGKLAELGIEDDTILIYTTDNGTAAKGGFNAGMRGKKGSPYEGGHRVPMMIRWPGGGIDGARVEPTLTHAVDVVPTLMDLCAVEGPPAVPLDGDSVAKTSLLLDGQPNDDADGLASWSPTRSGFVIRSSGKAVA